ASDQQTMEVRLHRACMRCGRPAEVLRQLRFGALVPACRRCARRSITLETVEESLGVPVSFSGEDARPASRLRRLKFILAQVLVPVAFLLAAAALSAAWHSAAPLAVVQLGIVGWLIGIPWTFGRLADRFGIVPNEAVRLQRRWSRVVAGVALACDF